MNVSDSERIRTFLDGQGYREVAKIEEADLVVINSCSVRKTAEDRALAFLKKCEDLKKEKKLEVILTGCMATKTGFSEKQRKIVDAEKKKLKRADQVLSIRDLCGKSDYFKISPKLEGQKELFLPIMEGCDNFCSYCIVPFTRGREKSRKIKEIVEELREALKKGYKNIVLLGQNVNSFGKENGENLPTLLKKINEVPGDFKVKFLTNHPKDMSDELIEAVAILKKIEKFIHLPLQSGSDRILKLMNRKYTQKDYLRVIEKIRKKIKKVFLATDVIVGFPGETWEDFQETVKVFKKVGYNEAYINKYSPRRPAAASIWEDNVTWDEKKKREKILREIINDKKKR
jgi:tRNA-2-methylthio-N6-dimethylallyladenosine synthase